MKLKDIIPTENWSVKIGDYYEYIFTHPEMPEGYSISITHEVVQRRQHSDVYSYDPKQLVEWLIKEVMLPEFYKLIYQQHKRNQYDQQESDRQNRKPSYADAYQNYYNDMLNAFKIKFS